MKAAGSHSITFKNTNYVMTTKRFLGTGKQCCENSRRLLDEAELLEFEKVLATRYYLSMIAQEETAKAFLLYLVSVNALPWTPLLLRATRDHQCKQLVGIILDYISPDTEEFLRRLDTWKLGEKQPSLPARVADAMNLLRHEKIRRWESKTWWWAEDPEYDKAALRVADGKRDREKQRALYVELSQNGEVAGNPEQFTEKQANDEYERARRFETCVRNLVERCPNSAWNIERVEGCFRALFSESTVFIESEKSCAS